MNIRSRIKIILALVLFIPQLLRAQPRSIVNFNSKGEQVTRFSKLGDAVDAHDGEIAYFDGVYYLYGTSYGCGFEWGHKDAPFCGFKVYSSKDMVNWTDKGALFDASTPVWQTRCNGNTYGCFRPHVIFNKTTGLYVLWINVYDNQVGYRVFTGKTPVGPFIEREQPKLSINSTAAVAGLNNGDHDTFVDDDGKAYLAYTDWRAGGAIAIEQLSADYLTGSGKVITAVTKTQTEAPALFKRKGIYYLVYSDPNCGYCAGTGASYRTANSPLGPWSDGIRISDNSCGGQPSFVSSIKLKTGDVFLFGSDLWNNAAKNESLANYYWAPLNFKADGAIEPLKCEDTYAVNADVQGAAGYKWGCDINDTSKRVQTFKAGKTGLLTSLSISAFKNGYPDADLTVEIADANGEKVLTSTTVTAASMSWSPGNIVIKPKLQVIAGTSYRITLSSGSNKGCYGVMNDLSTAGKAEKKFLFQTVITAAKKK